MITINNLNSEQKKALKFLLQSKQNVFLTGAAGTGKSQVIKIFREIKKMSNETIPMVASTGAAAILVNGVTFNSYFGLGIMAGGKKAVIENALHNRSLCERLIYTDTVVVDEISMISGEVFNTANELCQKIRQNKKFFGGIRVILVGDFFQLGPFSETEKPDWVFESASWKKSKMKVFNLKKIMRTSDKTFLDILGNIRKGKIDAKTKKFLTSKTRKNSESIDVPRIFSRNHEVDAYNKKILNSINAPEIKISTQYVGDKNAVERLKEQLVIAENIVIKKGALVMLRVNNFQEGFVNGTVGTVIGLSPDVLTIKKTSGEVIHVKKHIFEYIGVTGEVTAKAKNFPITLAWAITIHKSQGATLDKAIISLDRLWLHGQAYTALSRLKTAQGLIIDKWNKESFIVDKKVLKNFKN